ELWDVPGGAFVMLHTTLLISGARADSMIQISLLLQMSGGTSLPIIGSIRELSCSALHWRSTLSSLRRSLTRNITSPMMPIKHFSMSITASVTSVYLTNTISI